MIQKRYQYNYKEGPVWSSWFDYSDDDSQIEELTKNEAKQLGKLKNEYRIV